MQSKQRLVYTTTQRRLSRVWGRTTSETKARCYIAGIQICFGGLGGWRILRLQHHRLFKELQKIPIERVTQQYILFVNTPSTGCLLYFFNLVEMLEMLTVSSHPLLALTSSHSFICNMPSGIHLNIANSAIRPAAHHKSSSMYLREIQSVNLAAYDSRQLNIMVTFSITVRIFKVYNIF